jgi:hypothetical protein
MLVVVLAVLSWQMIHNVAVALYRQFEPLGDPGLMAIQVPGPGLEGKAASPGRPPSQLGHTGYFWSERAFHYRCTLMFAVDGYQDPSLLQNDTWQQHPDGVNAWRQYTLLMEPVYGFLYRLAGDQSRPLVEFLLRLVPLIHVLLFLPIYGITRALDARPLFALAAVAVYATCTLGFARLTGSLLLKEDFALLCLVGFLAAHLWAWRTERIGLAVAAALLLLPTLACWHLNQFLFLTVATGAAIAGTIAGNPEGGRRRFAVLLPALYLVAGLAASLTPSLAERHFVVSLPMAVLAAWLVTALSVERGGRLAASVSLRLIVLAGALVLLGAGSFLNERYTGDYNHVFGLLVAKLRHGLSKPEDPTALPFDVRVFWDSPFLAPTLDQIRSKLGFSTLLLGPAAIWSLVAALRRRTDPVTRSFLLTVPVMLAGYLLIERLGIIFLVFGVVAVALAAESVVRSRPDNRTVRRLPLLAVAGLLFLPSVLNLGTVTRDMVRISTAVGSGQDVRLASSDQAKWQAWAGLYDWVRRNTPGPGSSLAGEPASFLGEIGESPQLLLYTGRPVVLNSQFENAAIRKRYHRFLEALYGRQERDLWEFASTLQADFIFISRNFATLDATGSYPYLAGLEGPLTTDMNVVRMHFRPESLEYFEPVFDNEVYRVLRVLPSPDRKGPANWQRSFNLWWNPGNFTVRDGRLADLSGDRERIRAFEAALSDLQDEQNRMLAAVEDRYRRTRGQGRGRPDLMLMHRQLVQTRLERLRQAAPADGLGDREGRLANAISSRLAEIEPVSGRPLGTALEGLAHGPGGWLALLRERAGEPAHYATCGQLLALAGRYEEAADLFGQAAAFFSHPDSASTAPAELQIRLWQEQVWWLVGADRPGRARELAAAYGARVEPGSEAAAFFAAVAGVPAVD